jgi:hypothetical protein
MPVVPVRGIAKGGVITDMDPYSLPMGSWSMGVNVRFRNGDITRAPVFRTVDPALAHTSPRFLSANSPSGSYDVCIVGYFSGQVGSILSGVETDISIAGYTPSSVEAIYTSCHLGDVFYVNRTDRAPWSYKPGDTIMHVLANWAPVSSPWTCNILRASNSALIAFGITQNGASYPTMVLTSEFAIVDTVPVTWDYTLGTNNATSNVLGDMEGAIMDAAALGEIMIIYGEKECWTMVLDGSKNIWAYHKLFAGYGAINANCAVEVDKQHFVFGQTDIWKHDGTSPVSICDERTREFIFSSLNLSASNRCYARYNVRLKEIYFAYVSTDAFCAFPTYSACGANRQATYHVPTNTWSFDDLPYVFGNAMANVSTIVTWAGISGTYDTIGGTWADQEDSKKKVCVMVGDSAAAPLNLTESLYAYDLQGPGSYVAFNVDTNATKGWSLSRDGIDLDEVGADLKGYKTVNSIYPQGRLEPGAQPISFSFGSADYFNDNVVMSDPQTWDGDTLYKLDYNAAGRYLSMKVTHDDYRYMKLTGIDFDLDVLGER